MAIFNDGRHTTDTTSGSTDTGARSTADDRVTAAPGDPDMFTITIMTDPPRGTENVHEDPADVSREGVSGQGASASPSTGEIREESISPHFSEVLPSDELPLDTQPQTGDQELAPNECADRLEQDVADPVRELQEVNEDLRRQLADRQSEIDGLRKMLQVSADVIQAVPSGLFLFQYQPPGELFFLNCNPEATRLTGLEQEDCRGVELDEIWPNARGQGLTDAFLDAARSGKPFDASKTHYRNSKIERIFRVKAFAIPGERLGVAFLELTDQSQSEEALRRLQEEMDRRIEERTSQLVSRNEQLEAECASVRQSQEMALQSCRLAAQEEVAGRAARVLSNPIENVQDAATRALARLDSGYISLMRPSLEQIQQEANRLCCLVKYLKQCAGTAPAGGFSQCKALDLNGVVSESVEALSYDACNGDRKNVTPVFQELILGHDCCVNCDPSEIRDVVDTLLKHALDATDRRGGVILKTFSDKDCVVLEVGDEGGGIPENEMPSLFEPLCTSQPGYAGLGLAGVSGVVRRYGGEIGVVTDAGKGTTITVRLPRADGV